MTLERAVCWRGRRSCERGVALRIDRIEDWQKVRAGGKPRFVLVSGLARGIPMGFAVMLVIELFAGGPLPESLATWRFAWRALFAVAIFTASGCVSAVVSWGLLQKRFEGDGAGT
jgi:hypothetical protein